MKYVFALLLLSPFCARTQDCTLKKEKDTYTKEMKISTGFITLEGAMVSIEANKTEIDFLFSLSNNNKCFDDASAAAVFFENSKYKSNYKNNGTMNCQGLFHFIFRNTTSTPTALQNLANKKITSIKFKDGSGKETEVSFTPGQQQTFMTLAACMIKEAKTLLPK
jgi:hypothetical protein